MEIKSLQNNRYDIQAILGQGGYGITYLAEQTTLGRQVAIKEFFLKDYCGRAADSSNVTLGTDGSREMLLRYREKFKKEAATLARFNHLNIVRVIDMFEENNTYYYVMEYADGPSLSQIVKAQGKLPIDEALAMIRQVADAVSYLHQKGLCHYDIKPANILTNSMGKAILADFGLAKQYDEQGEETSTTPVGKSKGFAPPEQYRIGGVSDFSPETDIYALAATLYKLLTGITPIESLSRDDEEIDFSILPAALIAPIQKAMNLKRKERFHSVEEFLTALPKAESQSMSDNEVINQDNNAKDSCNDASKSEDTNLDINAPRPTHNSSEKSVREEKKTTIDWQKYLAPIGITAVLLVLILIWANKDTEPTTDPIAGTNTTTIEQTVTPSVENPGNILTVEEPANNSATSGNNTAETNEKPEKEEAQKKEKEPASSTRTNPTSHPTNNNTTSGDNNTIADKNKEENLINLSKYSNVRDYGEKIMRAELNGKWGWIDKKGNTIIPFKYDLAGKFFNGMAVVSQDGRYGIIDSKGNAVIPIKYDQLTEFNEGLARAQLNLKWGCIDQNDQKVIPFIYDLIGPFKNGKALVRIGEEEFYIDKQGNRL